MLLDCLSIVLAVRCKSEIASRQLIRNLASEYSDEYGKAVMLKVLPLLTPRERDWLKNW